MTAAAVPAAARSGILETGDAVGGPAPMAQAFIPPVSVSRRRLGGAFWALTGTVAAAAALAVGGLWWTNGLNSGTETRSADQVEVDDDPETAADGSEKADADGTGQAGASPDSTDRSDSQSTEFGSRVTSETDGPTTTPPTTRPRRTTTSAKATTSTAGRRSSGTITTAGNGTTAPGTGAGSTTSAPSATEPPVTERTTTSGTPTTAPPTTGQTSPPAPGFIGDMMTIDSYDGPTVSGALVELYNDENRDGNPESLVNSTRTAAGRYGFEVAAGCYVVRFYAPDGFQIQPGLERQAACVEAGGSAARVDAVLTPIAPPAGPSSCVVEWPGNESYLGVEVYENQSNWADSYTFYGKNGKVVARTRDLGSADDVEGPTNREWESEASGFKHRDVYSVAAERGGENPTP